jgi:hypothetical protein
MDVGHHADEGQSESWISPVLVPDNPNRTRQRIQPEWITDHHDTVTGLDLADMVDHLKDRNVIQRVPIVDKKSQDRDITASIDTDDTGVIPTLTHLGTRVGHSHHHMSRVVPTGRPIY